MDMKTLRHFVVPFVTLLLLALGAGGAAAHPQLSGSTDANQINALTWAVPPARRGVDNTPAPHARSASGKYHGVGTHHQ
jgi:hypothetical protein